MSMENKERFKVFIVAFLSTVYSACSQQRLSDISSDKKELPNQAALLELSSSSKGLLHARVGLENTLSASPFEKHTAGMMVYNTSNKNDLVPGIYYNDGVKWILSGSGIPGDRLPGKVLVTDSTGRPQWKSAALPNFFYMPSVLIPVSEDQFVQEIEGEIFGTINLHKRYVKQFDTPMARSGNAPALPVVAETDLYYYITWYDSRVFSSVTLSETGVLKYVVKPEADSIIGTFMNIVFLLK